MTPQELQKLLSEINALSGPEVAERIAKLTRQQAEHLKGAQAATDAMKTLAEERLRLLSQESTYAEERLGQLGREIGDLRRRNQEEEAGLNRKNVLLERSNLINEAQAEHNELSLKLLEEQFAAGKQINENKLLRLRNAKKINDLEKQGVGNAKDLGKSLANNLKLTTKASFSSEKMAGSFTKVLSVLLRGPEAVGAMFGALSVGMLVKFVDNMVNLAVDLYEVENAFMKATGASEKFARGVTGTYAATRLYGVSAQEASQANMALYNTFTDFTLTTASARQELSNTATVLGELGVSYDSYAKSVQTATKALGVATDQADDMMRGLTAHAMDIGVPIDQLTSQFASMSPQLAKLGANGVKAFKDMAVVAKVTGFEMEKLLQLTNKFDTFEGAAEMAGKLNAAIGGNFVNAMDLMMTTDPVERFSMLRDSLLDAGLSFDDMSYYQRQFYTESLGLSDVSDLAKMMSGDFEALDANIGKTSKDYEEMAKRAAAVQDIQTSLQSLLAELTPILTPIIAGIRSFVGWLVEFTKENKLVVQSLGVFIGLLGTVLTIVPAVTLVIKAFTLLTAAFGVVFGAATVPIWGTVAAVAALTAGIMGLIHWFTKDIGESTILDVVEKLGGMKGFGGFAMSVKQTGVETNKTADIMGRATPRITTTARQMKKVTTEAGVAPATAAAAAGTPAPATTIKRPPDEYKVQLNLTMDGDVIDKRAYKMAKGYLEEVTTAAMRDII